MTSCLAAERLAVQPAALLTRPAGSIAVIGVHMKCLLLLWCIHCSMQDDNVVLIANRGVVDAAAHC